MTAFLTKDRKLFILLGVHLHGNVFWGPENANLLKTVQVQVFENGIVIVSI